MPWKNVFFACFGLLHIGAVWAASFWFFAFLKAKGKFGAELQQAKQRVRKLRRLTLILLFAVVFIYALLFGFFPDVLR